MLCVQVECETYIFKIQVKFFCYPSPDSLRKLKVFFSSLDNSNFASNYMCRYSLCLSVFTTLFSLHSEAFDV